MLTANELKRRTESHSPDHRSSSVRSGIQERRIGESRILIVDDEQLNIDVVRRYLEIAGYTNIMSTDHAGQVLPMMGQHHPDVVLLDIHMPEINGLDILRAIRSDDRLSQTPVLILTGSSAPETKLSALQSGATDLLPKPVHREELLARLGNVLRVKAYQDRLHRQSEELEEAVRRRTEELELSRLDVIHCLARAAEFRDDDTGQHVLRVGRYARVIGHQLGFSKKELDVLEPAAQLHDVGKIGIADSILLKPGKLTPEEFELMQKHCGFGKKIAERISEKEAGRLRTHTEIGARIMETASSPILEMARRIALTHHERWDGSGYPLGLAGEDIPLEGRITAVADVFDALSSKRSYKPAFPLKKCFEIMEEGRGSHFDPTILDAFFARREDIIDIQINSADTD
jgi:putative two-component system response regulator